MKSLAEEKKSVELEQLDFAKSLADISGDIRGSSANLRNATSTTIANLFSNPESNSDKLAQYMELIYKKNGSVGGTFRYYQSHIPYNYFIYPTRNDKTGYEMPSEKDEYTSVADFIEQYNVKFYAPYFFKQTLLTGVSFFYKISDSKGVAYMEFPIDNCRIYGMTDGVYRWEIDMSKLSEGASLPAELQKALENFASGNTGDEKRWTENKWYKVSDKGVAFALDQGVMKYGTAISEFSPLLEDSIQLENAKKNVEVRSELDTVRLVHSQIPTDKEGRPLMKASTAKVYDAQIKRSLPKGVSSITSPMKTETINLNGSGDSKAYDMVRDAQKQLFLSTGTHSSLFGGETSSSNIVKLAIQKDANWIYTKALPMFENYYNSELARYKSASKMIWKMSFIRQSNFTQKDDMQVYEKTLAQGGSRTMFLASAGMTPSMISNLLEMEQDMLDIDSFMIPKQTSFTMSSSGSGSEIGRPKTDEPTDDTDRINDAM